MRPLPGQGGGKTQQPGQATQTAGQAKSADGSVLTPEQQAQIAELKARDQEVRQHEAAHAGRGGAYAGSPSFTYTTGPDGKQYATGGEVSIDVSPVSGDPAATIQKLRTVIAAALAPADPSGQDQAVAAQAQAALARAQAELATKSAEGRGGSGEPEIPGQSETSKGEKIDGRFAQAAGAYRNVGQAAQSGGRGEAVSSVGLVA